jgi:hypothetical protein
MTAMTASFTPDTLSSAHAQAGPGDDGAEQPRHRRRSGWSMRVERVIALGTRRTQPEGGDLAPVG